MVKQLFIILLICAGSLYSSTNYNYLLENYDSKYLTLYGKKYIMGDVTNRRNDRQNGLKKAFSENEYAFLNYRKSRVFATLAWFPLVPCFYTLFSGGNIAFKTSQGKVIFFTGLVLSSSFSSVAFKKLYSAVNNYNDGVLFVGRDETELKIKDVYTRLQIKYPISTYRFKKDDLFFLVKNYRFNSELAGEYCFTAKNQFRKGFRRLFAGFGISLGGLIPVLVGIFVKDSNDGVGISLLGTGITVQGFGLFWTCTSFKYFLRSGHNMQLSIRLENRKLLADIVKDF